MGSAEQVKGHVYLSQGKVLSQRAKQDLLAGQLQEATPRWAREGAVGTDCSLVSSLAADPAKPHQGLLEKHPHCFLGISGK